MPGTTSFLNSEGNLEWGRISYGIKGGIDFYLGENDVLGFSGNYGNRDNQQNVNSTISQWSESDPERFVYSSLRNRKMSGDYYRLTSNYLKTFGNKNHKLYAEIFLGHNNSDEITVSPEVQNNIQIGGKKTSESGPSTDFNAKLQYTLPFSEVSKFEAGYEGEIDKSEENTGLSEFNTNTGEYEIQNQYTNFTKYDDRTHA